MAVVVVFVALERQLFFEWIRDNDAKMMGDGDGVVGRPAFFISFFSAIGSQSNAVKSSGETKKIVGFLFS